MNASDQVASAALLRIVVTAVAKSRPLKLSALEGADDPALRVVLCDTDYQWFKRWAKSIQITESNQ